jgi:nanoRNase/pAp phosphatase (c-di-AMP/oligoRNAs hydrolase)
MQVESILIKKETEQNFKKLMDMVQPNDSLLLLMHGSPDPDAIASAMALHDIIRQKKGLAKSAFVSTEPIKRQQNKDLRLSMRLNIHLVNQVDINSYRLIALLDAQPSFLDGVLKFLQPHIVFDHHPREGDWNAPLEDIRPKYGALSTILTEYLLCSRIKVSKNLHTALLYGIKTDTDNFDRDTIIEDISAYAYHTKYGNLRLIRRIELNQTPISYLKYFDQAFHHMSHFRGRRIGFLGHVESPDVCVQVADFYLRLIGTYYVVVAGIVDDKLIIIFRGDGYRKDCGAIAQNVCGLIGQGGGHRSAARIEISLEVLNEELNDDLSQRNIEMFLLECLKKNPKFKTGKSEKHTQKQRKGSK